MAFIGNTSTTQSFAPAIDYFSGNGSTVAFTLSRNVASVTQIQVVIENVPQNPSSAFSVLNNVITFTSAPPSGTNNIYVEYVSTIVQTIQPSQGTVGQIQLASPTGTGNPVLSTSPSITTPTIDKVNTSLAYTSLGPGNASIMKNRLINGAMFVDQRNNGASVTIPATLNTYTLDRWVAYSQQASKFSVQQNAGSVTPPATFQKYLGCTSLSAYSVLSTDYFIVSQVIEAFNVSDTEWGTASAKPFTLSAWVRSSLTGTFGGSVTNQVAARSYPFTYSIPTANTWTYISVTIPGDISPFWPKGTNGFGMRISFSLGAGATYSGTAGAWSGNAYYSATGATSVVGTNGATLYVTGVQFELGSSATGFEYVNYQTSLSNCQRYFIFANRINIAPTANRLYLPATNYCFRSTPTITTANANTLETGTAQTTPTWIVNSIDGTAYSSQVTYSSGGVSCYSTSFSAEL